MITRVGKECCGCSACANICPKHCIRMAENDEGFLYPQIQEENCVNCGACEKVCPVLQEASAEDSRRQAWAVVNRDQDVLIESSSGGLFSALADEMIARGGCVFGAAFTADFSRVHHIMAENPEDLCALRGSKYMQSDPENCFPAVREQLDQDRWVLFTGTPCQIAGLKGFLGRDHERLICADVICHGTPPSLLWRSYLTHIQKKLGGRTIAVNFRDKTDGWKKYAIKITAEDGKIYRCVLGEDPYLRMFLKNVCLRESCYHCHVKENGFFSDITMGDLWGVEQILPEIESEQGVSFTLVHTEKGRLLFEQIRRSMSVLPVDIERALPYNPVVTDSVRRPYERDAFFADLKTLSWKKLERRYAREKLSHIIRQKIATSVIGNMKRAIFDQQAGRNSRE